MRFFKRKFKKDAQGNTINEFLSGIFPRCLKIGIPDSDSKVYKTKYYNMPYINLLLIAPIHIESIKTELDVSLVGMDENKGSGGDMKDFDALPSMRVDVMGGEFAKEKGASIHISLTMNKHDLPEGTSRMINEIINQAQGHQEELILKREEKSNKL